jgi:hypothetical protein
MFATSCPRVPQSRKSPRLSTTYEGTRPVIAIVDSGAERSMFPKAYAAALGLQLVEAEDKPHALDGTPIMAWRALDPLDARILAIFPKRAKHWGPTFDLRPFFTETSTSVLGRRDFFSRFTVTFQDMGERQLMHLDYGFLGGRVQWGLTQLGRVSPMHRLVGPDGVSGLPIGSGRR